MFIQISTFKRPHDTDEDEYIFTGQLSFEELLSLYMTLESIVIFHD